MSSLNGASSKILKPEHKLRDLPLKETYHIINILNRNNCWRELAAVITHPNYENRLLFNSDHVGILENEWKRGKSPGETMLQRWSTTGRIEKLPVVSDLIHSLEEAGLSRAVSDVKRILFKDAEEDDSGIAMNTSQAEDNDYSEVDIIAEALSSVNIENLNVYSYRNIQSATNNFSNENTLGEGAFSIVYRATLSDTVVAVKKLKDPVDRQFITELSILTRIKHENLLPIVGCSFNGPTCCLVYEYMVNGSLQDKLACVGHSKPLPWEVRVKIAYGTALGIHHLHTACDPPMVHRDVKSANILLDKDFSPKLGDFGLVRKGDSSTSTLMPVTENVYGTSVYMPPEAFRGDVSTKLDTFSYGVVLLELLTGLPPYDSEREDADLICHVQNCDAIDTVLDGKILWNKTVAKGLYKIAEACLSLSKRERPEISSFLETLADCVHTLLDIPGCHPFPA